MTHVTYIDDAGATQRRVLRAAEPVHRALPESGVSRPHGLFHHMR